MQVRLRAQCGNIKIVQSSMQLAHPQELLDPQILNKSQRSIGEAINKS
jgi:hypothetical protein